ncbi:hypothetical protein [Methylocapsa sp. S129]|uniref:hypothetical protein n=1 Tax=Methylocapsa sp. S129 TaxID=1641869 RepID=UPI00131C59D2|nr:hypothetical protein [Methylocapsa sp. S129]
MSPNDLTTLPALKAWLGLPASASPYDATLAALITAASRAIYALLSRPALLPQDYNEVLDGESARITLRHWPVQSIASLAIDNLAVPPVVAGVRHGYLLQSADIAPPSRQQAVDIFGRWVLRGRLNVAISYTAGYAVSGEAQIVPASAPWQIAAAAPYGPWGCDVGIVYAATGAALTAVGASPSAGQYAVSGGLYSFSAADAATSLSISYGYIPQDIAQAALELAAERFRAAERIGLKSKSVGGQETIAYDTSAMSAAVLALLQPYRRVTMSC